MMKEGIMKSKIWSILVVFILVLIISSTGLYAQSFEGRGYDVLTQEVEIPYSVVRLKQIFNERMKDLKKYFKDNDFTKIVDYYGPRGWIQKYGDGVEYARGVTEIESYLQELNELGVLDKFKCKKVFIDFDEVLYNNPSPDSENDPVYLLREDIGIIIDIQGHSSHVLESSASSRHPRRTFD